jgi:hypothetical protein
MTDTTMTRRAGEQTAHTWQRLSTLGTFALSQPARDEHDAVQARARTWLVGTIAVVVFWSLTYLLRQPGVADVAARPFSLFGDFALEGAFLALAWLCLVVAASVGVLRGAIVFSSSD